MVTLDADGQNDPGELPDLLEPLLDDEADFVIASRRLGVDETTDQVRQSGVVFFAWLINRLIGQHLTDTSNGFRALRTEVLEDVTFEQDQYQTAELIISAASRGWRMAERPTVWHPRASGTSKKGTTCSSPSGTPGWSSAPGGGHAGTRLTPVQRRRSAPSGGRPLFAGPS